MERSPSGGREVMEDGGVVRWLPRRVEHGRDGGGERRLKWRRKEAQGAGTSASRSGGGKEKREKEEEDKGRGKKKKRKRT